MNKFTLTLILLIIGWGDVENTETVDLPTFDLTKHELTYTVNTQKILEEENDYEYVKIEIGPIDNDIRIKAYKAEIIEYREEPDNKPCAYVLRELVSHEPKYIYHCISLELIVDETLGNKELHDIENVINKYNHYTITTKENKSEACRSVDIGPGFLHQFSIEGFKFVAKDNIKLGQDIYCGDIITFSDEYFETFENMSHILQNIISRYL